MPETLLRHYDFQFQVALPRGSWRWTTRIDNTYAVGSAQILEVITPYGVLRDSIPIPGDIVFAMADSIRTAGGQEETTSASHVAIIPAFEDLEAGDFVTIADIGGAKARKALASGLDRRAHGYVLTDVVAGSDAIIHFEGLNTRVTQLTPGAMQFLSATLPGGTTEMAPSVPGQIVQTLGIAASATAINFELTTPMLIGEE